MSGTSTNGKVLLMQPTPYDARGRLFQTRTRWVLGLTLPYVAALTPGEFHVKVIDERLANVELEEPFDLVALSVMTRSSRRAYDLARLYRDRNIPVVMGGFHVTINPEDAAAHADALVLGEAEEVWAEAIRDAAAGRLKPEYRRRDFHPLRGLPVPRYELLDLGKYKTPFLPVQTSRGCPHACAFCEVSHVYGRRYRQRPLDEVVEEIKQAGLKKVQFVDDNFAARRDYTMQLLEKLIPLKIRWTCLWTVRDSADEELLDLAKRSGCYHINMGIESVRPDSLKQMHKFQNRVREYARTLRILNKKGLFYSLNFIFGWDADTETTFDETLKFLEDNEVPLAFFSMLAPRRGTRIYRELEAEGRLIGEEAYQGRNPKCMFQPRNLTPDRLESKIWWTYRKFYSPRSMLRRRVFGHRRLGAGNIIMSNLLFAASTRVKASPLDFY